MADKEPILHFLSLSENAQQLQMITCCGLGLPNLDKGVLTGAKAELTDDPRKVTCKLCLRNRALREVIEGWPDMEMISGSFDMLDAPEKGRRRLTFVSAPLTKEEMQILGDLLEERAKPWLQPSIAEVPKPVRHLYSVQGKIHRERQELRERMGITDADGKGVGQ